MLQTGTQLLSRSSARGAHAAASVTLMSDSFQHDKQSIGTFVSDARLKLVRALLRCSE